MCLWVTSWQCFDTSSLFDSQQYPDYYAIIKDPIDLKIISQKIQVSIYIYSPQVFDQGYVQTNVDQYSTVSTHDNTCFLQMGNYRSVSAMAKDVDLLTKNAKTYNEPGSQVFKVSVNLAILSVCLSVFLCMHLSHVLNDLLPKDANNIKKLFAQKKADMDHAEPVKSSIRIR